MTKTIKIILSVLHAIWLVGLTWLWLNDYRVLGDEKALIKWSAVVTRLMLGVESDLPPESELLFINVDHDVACVPRPEGAGRDVITDRRLLADALHVINQFPDAYRFVVCDIFLEGESEADGALNEELSRMDRILAPFHRDASGKPILPAFHVGHALADYQSVDGAFYKWRLMEEQGKTLPLVLYERLSGKEMTKRWGFYWMDGRPCLNRMIIDPKLRPALLTRENPRYPVFSSLEDLARFRDAPPEVLEKAIHPLIRDRIIVIGPLSREAHGTVLGPMGGALILMNTYYGLVQGLHMIHLGMVLLLILVYSLISYQIFWGIPFRKPEWLQRFLETKPGKFCRKYLSILGLLLLTSTLCYVGYGTHLNILFVTVYIHLLKKAEEKIRSWRKSPEDA